MINFIDLFSGCGGLSEGFMKAGDYRGVAHVEWDIPMVKTLRHRLESHWGYSSDEAFKRVVHYDIMDVAGLINGPLRPEFSNNHQQLLKTGLKSIIDSHVDLVIGGPPCQAYSIAGRAQDATSMRDDYRNYLFENFCEVVNEYRPKIFVFENVPGILTAMPGGTPVTQRIYDSFRKIGYQIIEPHLLKDVAVVNAKDFGVPQARRRVIIIGIRHDSELNLTEIYESLKKEKTDSIVTVGDSFNMLTNEFTVSDPASTHRNANARDRDIFKDWVIKNMNTKSTHERLEFYQTRTGKRSNHIKYRNLEVDKPSPTIVAHLKKDGLMFIHPDPKECRTITVREAALLQSFPLDYEFKGSMGSNYQMIGNAVPVELARRIAKSLKKFLK